MDQAFRLIQCDEDYEKDREFSSQCTPAVRRLIQQTPLRPKSVRDATFHEDVHQATDLVGAPPQIAMRVRRPEYARFGDVTIRSWRKSGARTEKPKIFEDRWGDFYFYGYGAEGNDFEIGAWCLLDLDILRDEYRRDPALLRPERLNPDGKSAFQPIDMARVPSIALVGGFGFVVGDAARLGRRAAGPKTSFADVFGPLTRNTYVGLYALDGVWSPFFLAGLRNIGLSVADIPGDWVAEATHGRASHARFIQKLYGAAGAAE